MMKSNRLSLGWMLALGLVFLSGSVQAAYQNLPSNTSGQILVNINGKTATATPGGDVSPSGGSASTFLNGTGTFSTPSGSPTEAAGGDLGGTYPNPTVKSVSDVSSGSLSIANGGFPQADGALSANNATNIGTTRNDATLSMLPHWQAAIGRIVNKKGDATLLCDGDSTVTGMYTNGKSSGDQKSGSWCNQLTKRLNAVVIPAISQNFIGDGDNTVNNHQFDPSLNIGSWTSGRSSGIFGGNFLVASAATPIPLSFTPSVPVDTFKFCYATASGAGNFLWNMDGRASTNVPTGGSSGFACQTVTTPTPALHVINFNWVSGGQVFWPSIIDTNTTVKAVNVLNAGWPSSTTFNHSDAISPWNITNPTSIAAYAPDPAIEEGGLINDWIGGSSPSGVAINLTATANAWKTGGADFVFLTPNPSAATSVPITTQTALLTQESAVALAVGVPVIDYFDKIGSWEMANPAGVEFDTYHLLAAGYHSQASLIAKSLQIAGFSTSVVSNPQPGTVLPVANGGSPGLGLPCDILANAGTPCVAAHSMFRKMVSSYAGPLFNATRLSDFTTMNIGFMANGYVDINTLIKFCSGTYCTLAEIYDQMGTASAGNNLPQATVPNQPAIIYASAPDGLIPEASFNGYQYLRNRTNTVNMPHGSGVTADNTTEYMVIDNQNQGSACCGLYGNMETTIAATGNGHMFALAYSTGSFGTFGTGSGPWAGMDWENGVFLYGSSPVGGAFNTIISKYNNSGKSWTLELGNNTSSSLTTLYSGALPAGYTANFEGGISMGEGGDASPSAGNFIEGAITASPTSTTTDAILHNSIYNALISATAPAYTHPSCSQLSAGNLLPNSLNLTAWPQHSVTSVSTTTDPFGNNDAGLITGGTSSFSSIMQTLILSANSVYTLNVYVKSTTDATVFPTVSFVSNASGNPESAAVVDTNTGRLIIGRWNGGTALQMTSTNVNGWWLMKLVFLTGKGASGGTVYLGSPVSDAYGNRSNQSAGLIATDYCPSVMAGWQ